MTHVDTKLVMEIDGTRRNDDAQALRTLAGEVIIRALVDATTERPVHQLNSAMVSVADKEAADKWIRRCGRDFRFWCDAAGMDADFVRDAYVAGRINPGLLQFSDPTARKRRGAKNPVYDDKIRKLLAKGEMKQAEIVRRVGVNRHIVVDRLKTLAAWGEIAWRGRAHSRVWYRLAEADQ